MVVKKTQNPKSGQRAFMFTCGLERQQFAEEPVQTSDIDFQQITTKAINRLYERLAEMGLPIGGSGVR